MKTSELIGPALAWAVATCEGWGDWDGDAEGFFSRRNEPGVLWMHECNYPTDWSQGGPIIEREGLCVDLLLDGSWLAVPRKQEGCQMCGGPTPLIAAMRAFVASRLGEEVEIPEELAP